MTEPFTGGEAYVAVLKLTGERVDAGNVFDGVLWSLQHEPTRWRQRREDLATRDDGLRVATSMHTRAWFVDFVPKGEARAVHEARVPRRYVRRIRRAVRSLGERQTLTDFCRG